MRDMKRRKKPYFILLLAISESYAQTCTDDSSLFELTCTGVNFQIGVKEACLASGSSKYSLSQDFDSSIYVSSDSSDSSNINSMGSECKIAIASGEKEIKFNIEQCVENSVQPGTDVAKDKWLHPTTGIAQDTDPGSGTQVAADSVMFRYYIHHQRTVGSVDISSMSPVPVTCLIAKEVVAEQTATVNAQAQKIIENNTQFNADMVKLTITPDSAMAVGSLATLALDVSTTHDYQSEFNFAIKECSADTESADNKKVEMVKDFCKVANFGEIITRDTAAGARNTDVNNFQSFKFVIFKYPNEAKVVFTCTVTVFHKDITADGINSAGCELHDGTGSSRKRRGAPGSQMLYYDIPVSTKVIIPDPTMEQKSAEAKPSRSSSSPVSLLPIFLIKIICILNYF